MDDYLEVETPDPDVIANLGPLTPLAGVWEGEKGVDVAPDGPHASEETPFRERMSFEPIGPVVNGSQVLYGLRYATMAWPLGEEDPFHEEVGYWLWDPREQRVMRYFLVPRGVAVAAGGSATPDAKSFTLSAQIGESVFGLLSNPFLDRAFRSEGYELEVRIHEDGSFSYAEDTLLRMQGVAELFHHTDRNHLRRVSPSA